MKGKPFNMPVEDFLYFYNQKINISEIAKNLNVGSDVLGRYIKKNNLHRKKNYPQDVNRKYSYDNEYFNEINTPNKAYFLGFLYSDGCNTREGLALSLSEDVEILKKLKEDIKYTGKLVYKKSVTFVGVNGKTYTGKPQDALCIYSKNLSQQLSKLGCIPNKTLTLKFPTEEQVPRHLIHHFIRGYFDGDGCISIYEKDGYNTIFSCSGTEHMLIAIQNILIENCGVSKTKLYDNDKIKLLSYKGRLQAIKIMSYLYKDAELFLQRKYDKYKIISNVAK